ncbi:MAG: response regulator [Defluviitaleaceae bacterium]|nr:response regulator [Defluviitaleaceae bacterium]
MQSFNHENIESVVSMIDDAPIMIEFWNEDCEPIDCNKTALDFYEFDDKEAYKSAHSSITNRDVWNDNINKIFKEGSGEFDFTEQDAKGNDVFLEVYGQAITLNNKPVVVTYSSNVTRMITSKTAVEQVQNALVYRELLLKTVNKAAAVLLSANEQDTLNTIKVLMDGMEIIGTCLSVDRVQLWRLEPGGENNYVMRHQWLSESGKKNIEVPVGSTYPDKITAQISRIFKEGKLINSPIAKLIENYGLSEEDYELTTKYGTVSVAMIPLYTENKIIGFFEADDCEYERIFTEDEMEMLSSTGLMFSNVFDKMEQARIRKEAEIEERTNFILDTAPMAITLYNNKFKPIDCNKATVEMFGTKDKQEYLDRYLSLRAPEQLDSHNQQYVGVYIAKAFYEGYAHLPEFVCKNTSNSFITVETHFIRVRYKNDFAVIEYAHDITEKKQAAEKEQRTLLRERYAVEFTKKLLDNAPFFLELWDENGNIYECNEKLLNVLGIKNKEDLTARFFYLSKKIQPCGTPARELNIKMMNIAKEEGMSSCEWTYLLPDGSELPAETTWVHSTHNGKPITMVYSHDLRPIKAAMEKERVANEAARESKESNRAKSRFLARMSHEIRTPITAVMGISEIQLRKKNMPPQTEEAFTKIYDSSKSLLNIVNDILDFSKIESGKMSLINNEYDITSLVSDVAHLHLIFFERKNVFFKVHVDPNLPLKLIGDSLRIRQIISNLLTNAFKYTEVGTVSLSLSCEEESISCATIKISIQDTGIGMDTKQIDELNGDFTRFHERERPFVSGTGLGIPIVYSLANLMDATVEMKSEIGKGTNVTIRIPQIKQGSEILGAELAEKLQNPESCVWITERELESVPQEQMNGNVLVVDDVDTNLYVAEAMLESFGLTIDLCESGAEAIDKIKQGNNYDIIFMDYMMPEMNGIEAVKILRDMGYDNPIVAFTANAVKGEAEMFLDNGFSGFMSKPIDIKILYSYLVRFIEKKA